MALSPTAADHVNRPRNAGRLENATHVGVGGVPGDGPYVRIYLRISDGRIEAASYECNGCPSSIAASSMAAQVLIGRTVEKARLVTDRDLIVLLGGLPDGKEHCASLAAKALHSALDSQETGDRENARTI